MDGANAGTGRHTLRNALAGLQAGVLGALLMVGWLMLCSIWSRRSPWLVPNLFATTFYGSNVYRNQLLRTSWSGVALLLAIYGMGGMLWGLLWGDRQRRFMIAWGALAGLLVYLSLNLIGKSVNPLISLYAPDRQLEFGHVLWGVALARSARYARQITSATAERAGAAN